MTDQEDLNHLRDAEEATRESSKKNKTKRKAKKVVAERLAAELSENDAYARRRLEDPNRFRNSEEEKVEERDIAQHIDLSSSQIQPFEEEVSSCHESSSQPSEAENVEPITGLLTQQHHIKPGAFRMYPTTGEGERLDDEEEVLSTNPVRSRPHAQESSDNTEILLQASLVVEPDLVEAKPLQPVQPLRRKRQLLLLAALLIFVAMGIGLTAGLAAGITSRNRTSTTDNVNKPTTYYREPFLSSCTDSQDCADYMDCREGRCLFPSTVEIVKGLFVIMETPNVTLEDVHSEFPHGFLYNRSNIRQFLNDSSKHWSWLSHGNQSLVWTIRRMTWETEFTSNFFDLTGRSAIETKVLEKNSLGDYDQNGDGILDMLVILHTGSFDAGSGFLRTAKSDMHVMCCAGSLVPETGSIHTGNFHYDISEAFVFGGGLPKLWGDYNTLGDLSFNSYPFRTPTGGVTAWERMKAGWSVPLIVNDTTLGLTLSPTEQGGGIILIDVGDNEEFFMLEYRKRQKSGFGSQYWVAFNGILITHILQSKDNFRYDVPLANNVSLSYAFPNFDWLPLIRLEPPGGFNTYSDELQTKNVLFYPGNPNDQGGFVGQKYNDRAAIFIVDGFTWTSRPDEIQIDIRFLNV